MIKRPRLLRPAHALTAGKALAVVCMAAWATLTAPVVQAQQSLTVAAYPAVDEIVKAAIPQWKKMHPNVEIKVISRAFADHHTAMTTALSTASNLPDVMVLEKGYVARFSRSGGLENVGDPPYNFKAQQARFVPYAVQQGTGNGGAIVAVPADIGPGTLLYRDDILKKAGVSVEELTRSWESYVQSGVKIKAATGAYLVANAQDVKDIVIRSGIAPGDGLYLDSNRKVLVDSPRFVRAFTLAKQVRSLKLDAKLNAWTPEWAEAFKRGKLAAPFSGAWLSGHLNNWLAPATRGLWRASQLPDHAYASWGGTFYAIPKQATNKALAWDLIQLMTQRADMQLQAFKAQDAFPALLEVYNDPFFGEPIAFLGGQKARLLWRDASQKIGAIQVDKLDNIAEEIVNTELDKVLAQNKDIPTALADAKRLLEHRANRKNH